MTFSARNAAVDKISTDVARRTFSLKQLNFLFSTDLVPDTCRSLGFWTAGQRVPTQATFAWKLVTSDAYQELPFNYTYWSSGEPNSAHEACVHAWQAIQYQWNDAVCTASMCFVCEYDI